MRKEQCPELEIRRQEVQEDYRWPEGCYRGPPHLELWAVVIVFVVAAEVEWNIAVFGVMDED